jgi:CDP-diacylglycerol--serine O-phosphatidyltransferase
LFARVTGRRHRYAGETEVGLVTIPGQPGRVGTLVEAPVSPAPTGAPYGPSAARPRRRSTGDDETVSTIPLLPGDRTPARRLKFAIANGCTIGSLVMGLVAIFLAMSGNPDKLHLAAVALLACVVFDGCDGGLARRFNVASPFGAQLDSLADLSSFGVATGVVTYQWLVSLGASQPTAAIACVLIAACAAIRLARFNVSPKSGSHFSGVPTTMVAAVLALNILVGPDTVPVLAQVAFVSVYALAMVTPFPYVKLVRILRLPPWVWVAPAICAMVSVPGTFVALVGGYLVSGPVLWLVKRRRTGGRRPALA